VAIVRIEKKNLVDEVYGQMCEQIASGKWKEGEKIASEHRLCELFNVSRVVIREALQRLRMQGLVVTRRGMGSFISNPNNFLTDQVAPVAATPPLRITEKDYLSFIEFRSCIEFKAIELSTTRATAEDYANIQGALLRMKRSIGDLDAFTQADLAFHTAIVESAHNIFFTQTMKSCREMILFCLHEMNNLNDTQNWGIEIHRDLADYIIARDIKSALKALKNNNDYNLARLERFFKDTKQLGENRVK